MTHNVSLRRSVPADLPFITTLERHPDNRELVGQWSDAEHRAAISREQGREHWLIERDAEPAGYFIAFDCRETGAGIYVKRILVKDKERGTGTAALRLFVEEAFAREGVSCVWLNVRNANHRAQAVYGKLGFERFDPDPVEAEAYDRHAEATPEHCFRMRKLVPDTNS